MNTMTIWTAKFAPLIETWSAGRRVSFIVEYERRGRNVPALH